VDNGPDIPALLDRILQLTAERGEAVAAIAGNHDVVCSRSLETLGTEEGKFWGEKWQRGHWNPEGDTPSRYGAPCGNVAGLAERMPVRAPPVPGRAALVLRHRPLALRPCRARARGALGPAR